MRARRLLTALPVYNEQRHVLGVLDSVVQHTRVVRHTGDVLVVDDGSTDETPELLKQRIADHDDIRVVTHKPNRGYGAALRTAFCYAKRHAYDVLVTIDCDGQHEPQRIRELADACVDGVDIVSGSRYLDASEATGRAAPADRRRINATITAELNKRLGLGLTDAFCGFKAYRVSALGPMRLQEDGYAMPLELWVQAAHHGLNVVEAAVPRIYLEEERTFGAGLDDAAHRLAHYREVIDRAAAVVDIQRSPEEDPCAGLLAPGVAIPALG